jgi:hypothetical protein
MIWNRAMSKSEMVAVADYIRNNGRADRVRIQSHKYACTLYIDNFSIMQICYGTTNAKEQK